MFAHGNLHVSFLQFFWAGTSAFWGTTDTPVLDFWWCHVLIWKPEQTALFTLGRGIPCHTFFYPLPMQQICPWWNTMKYLMQPNSSYFRLVLSQKMAWISGELYQCIKTGKICLFLIRGVKHFFVFTAWWVLLQLFPCSDFSLPLRILQNWILEVI